MTPQVGNKHAEYSKVFYCYNAGQLLPFEKDFHIDNARVGEIWISKYYTRKRRDSKIWNLQKTLYLLVLAECSKLGWRFLDIGSGQQFDEMIPFITTRVDNNKHVWERWA